MPLRITNPLGETGSSQRGGFGRVQSITAPAPLNFQTTFGYEDTTDIRTGLLKTVTDLLSNITTRTYDPLGRLVIQSDRRAYTTQFTYDLLNRLTSVADPLGHGVRFEYDPNGNLSKVTDPRCGTILYEYDEMDRVKKRTDPVGKFESYTYELTGHLKTVTDRKNQQTVLTYDDLNRRQTVTYKKADGSTEATVTYGYDAASRLTSLNDSLNGPITWVLDPLDRLTSETTPQGSVQFPDDPNPALAGYDDAGRRKRMVVSGGLTVTYAYDDAGRLRTVAAEGQPPTATYDYDDADRRTFLTLLNGVKTEYGYDNASRLTRLTYKQGVTTLGELLYGYDPAGNRLTMSGSWARTTLPAGFTPCASSSACYDLANRHLPGVSVGGKKVTYDFNGNVTQVDDGAATNFTWDVRDRLTALGGAATASFTYDALGRRSAKTISGTSTTFRYDGWDIVREVIGTSGVNYLRGLAIDEPLIRAEESGTTTQYLTDALGSTWALTNDTGVLTSAYRYGPFGQTTVDSGSSSNAFQYTGRENDATGLYHYRSRYYHSGLQRFATEDRLRMQGGPNYYAYVANNPTRFIDPLGLVLRVRPWNPRDRRHQAAAESIRKRLEDLRERSGVGRGIIERLEDDPDEYNIIVDPDMDNIIAHADLERNEIIMGTGPGPRVCTESGIQRIPVGVVLGHELGHLRYPRIRHPSPMDLLVENSIRRDLGLPERTQYEGPPCKKRK